MLLELPGVHNDKKAIIGCARIAWQEDIILVPCPAANN